MIFKKASLSTFLTCALLCPLAATQTIAEKKESFSHHEKGAEGDFGEELGYVNSLLEEKRFDLRRLYDQASYLYHKGVDLAEYENLLKKIKTLKGDIADIQQMWRDEVGSFASEEGYALWHQPDATIQELVIDYGAADAIYLIPEEVGMRRISLNSNLPIPREAWGECLELILARHGIGVRELSPFIRELYELNYDGSGIKGFVTSAEELDFYPPHSHLCYILKPSSTDPRTDLHFLSKFSDPQTTDLEIITGKIFIMASVETIQELLKLYEFARDGTGQQEYRLASLSKIGATEMVSILDAAFYDSQFSGTGTSLRILPLQNGAQSLFMCGSSEDMKKAIALIQEVEGQIEDPQEKTVFWYTTKHSEATELAAVLAKVYDLLVDGNLHVTSSTIESSESEETQVESLAVPTVDISSKGESKTTHKTADGQNNFIVDPKTGAIIMVVEQEALPKIKDLLKKLDVPKKMVQLEVLLFEKRVSNQNKIGLNLLRLGSQASNLHATGLSWAAPGSGILEFLISRSKGSGIPAYDLAYQFMLGQEDVQINASPSVTTMNQTPAKIAVVEEISVDAGADEKKNRIYHRSQYGIIIEITPTINMDEGEEGFITLDTEITFDTPKKNVNDRPDVTRRLIKNHVRIADGETVILGGLRRKNSQDNKESIPFLGEIPGIGKLFSHTEMSDSATEMFVFITPKIIADPIEDAQRVRKEELKKRPGDIPEFLHELCAAQQRDKRRLFEGSLTALFGREKEAGAAREDLGEYDGRGQ